MAFYLQQINSKKGSLKIPLNKEEVIVGRKHFASVFLSVFLSRKHASFQVSADNQWFVKDLSLINGTFVNGEKIGIGLHRLKVGDTVGFGVPHATNDREFEMKLCVDRNVQATYQNGETTVAKQQILRQLPSDPMVRSTTPSSVSSTSTCGMPIAVSNLKQENDFACANGHKDEKSSSTARDVELIELSSDDDDDEPQNYKKKYAYILNGKQPRVILERCDYLLERYRPSKNAPSGSSDTKKVVIRQVARRQGQPGVLEDSSLSSSLSDSEESNSSDDTYEKLKSKLPFRLPSFSIEKKSCSKRSYASVSKIESTDSDDDFPSMPPKKYGHKIKLEGRKKFKKIILSSSSDEEETSVKPSDKALDVKNENVSIKTEGSTSKGDEKTVKNNFACCTSSSTKNSEYASLKVASNDSPKFINHSAFKYKSESAKPPQKNVEIAEKSSHAIYNFSTHDALGVSKQDIGDRKTAKNNFACGPSSSTKNSEHGSLKVTSNDSSKFMNSAVKSESVKQLLKNVEIAEKTHVVCNFSTHDVPGVGKRDNAVPNSSISSNTSSIHAATSDRNKKSSNEIKGLGCLPGRVQIKEEIVHKDLFHAPSDKNENIFPKRSSILSISDEVPVASIERVFSLSNRENREDLRNILQPLDIDYSLEAAFVPDPIVLRNDVVDEKLHTAVASIKEEPKEDNYQGTKSLENGKVCNTVIPCQSQLVNDNHKKKKITENLAENAKAVPSEKNSAVDLGKNHSKNTFVSESYDDDKDELGYSQRYEVIDISDDDEYLNFPSSQRRDENDTEFHIKAEPTDDDFDDFVENVEKPSENEFCREYIPLISEFTKNAEKPPENEFCREYIPLISVPKSEPIYPDEYSDNFTESESIRNIRKYISDIDELCSKGKVPAVSANRSPSESSLESSDNEKTNTHSKKELAKSLSGAHKSGNYRELDSDAGKSSPEAEDCDSNDYDYFPILSQAFFESTHSPSDNHENSDDVSRSPEFNEEPLPYNQDRSSTNRSVGKSATKISKTMLTEAKPMPHRPRYQRGREEWFEERCTDRPTPTHDIPPMVNHHMEKVKKRSIKEDAKKKQEKAKKKPEKAKKKHSKDIKKDLQKQMGFRIRAPSGGSAIPMREKEHKPEKRTHAGTQAREKDDRRETVRHEVGNFSGSKPQYSKKQISEAAKDRVGSSVKRRPDKFCSRSSFLTEEASKPVPKKKKNTKPVHETQILPSVLDMSFKIPKVKPSTSKSNHESKSKNSDDRKTQSIHKNFTNVKDRAPDASQISKDCPASLHNTKHKAKIPNSSKKRHKSSERDHLSNSSTHVSEKSGHNEPRRFPQMCTSNVKDNESNASLHHVRKKVTSSTSSSSHNAQDRTWHSNSSRHSNFNGVQSVPEANINPNSLSRPAVVDCNNRNNINNLKSKDPSAIPIRNVSAESDPRFNDPRMKRCSGDGHKRPPLLPMPSVGSLLPTPSMGSLLPTPSVGSLLPTPSVGSLLPTPSVGSLLPTLSVASSSKVHWNSKNSNVITNNCETSTNSNNIAYARQNAHPPVLQRQLDPLPKKIDFDYVLAEILKAWHPNWLEQYAGNGMLPPRRVSENAFQLPLSYTSCDQYITHFYPMLRLEIWEEMFEEWSTSKGKNMIGLTVSQYTRTGDLMMLNCQSLVNKNSMFLPREGNLLIIELRVSNLEQSHKCIKVFGFVNDCEVMPYRRKVTRLHNDWYKRPESRDRDSVLYNFSVKMNKISGITLALGTLMKASVIHRISTKLKLADVLQFLVPSTLKSAIFQPNYQAFRVNLSRKKLPSSVSGNYNEQQILAIANISEEMRTAPTMPKMVLLQGPPGTGKTHTIAGIVQALISNPNDKVKILVVAASNAAVDEIARRLIHVNSTRNKSRGKYGRPMRLVRVGVSSQIHQDVFPYSLDNLVNVNMKDDINKELISYREKLIEKQNHINEIEHQLHVMRTSSMPNIVAIRGVQSDLECQIRRAQFINLEIEKCQERLRVNSFSDSSKEMYYKLQLLQKADVILSTLNSCRQRNLTKVFNCKSDINFTCCIVDEATQCTELEVLQPLVFGICKFILVGDDKQLQATVRSKLAEENNFSRSLFQRAQDFFSKNRLPSPVIMLTEQYRMHSEICWFPSCHFYNSKLKTPPGVNKPFPFRPFVILDILYGQETNLMSSKTNLPEAEAMKQICKHIFSVMSSKQEPFSIGIVTPYQAQKNIYLKHFSSHQELRKVEINTVDGFQGREKDIIIVSCVRANSDSGGIGFLASKNRLNVAITRARRCLIICGHMNSLMCDTDWGALIGNAKRRNLYYPVTCDKDIPLTMREIQSPSR